MGDENGKDPFKMPKEKGMFKVVASGSPLTTHAIVERIIENRLLFEERNKKKEKKEADCFAAIEKLAAQKQERKALEEKENV